MQKRLTITIDEKVYEGLKVNIKRGKISQFIEDLVRPHVMKNDMDSAYLQMSNDSQREKEALQWSEISVQDLSEAQ